MSTSGSIGPRSSRNSRSSVASGWSTPSGRNRVVTTRSHMGEESRRIRAAPESPLIQRRTQNAPASVPARSSSSDLRSFRSDLSTNTSSARISFSDSRSSRFDLSTDSSPNPASNPRRLVARPKRANDRFDGQRSTWERLCGLPGFEELDLRTQMWLHSFYDVTKPNIPDDIYRTVRAHLERWSLDKAFIEEQPSYQASRLSKVREIAELAVMKHTLRHLGGFRSLDEQSKERLLFPFCEADPDEDAICLRDKLVSYLNDKTFIEGTPKYQADRLKIVLGDLDPKEVGPLARVNVKGEVVQYELRDTKDNHKYYRIGDDEAFLYINQQPMGKIKRNAIDKLLAT